MDPNDEQLVRLCKQQLPYDATAFEVLLRRYEKIVFRSCERYLRNEQEAEEACQDAFLRVFHGLPSFEGRAKFRTWLFRIVINVCATRFAKVSRRAGEHREYAETTAAEMAVGYEPKPMDFADVNGVIGEGLDMLSPDDRQILILRHIGELSFDELAATLELGLSAAKMRLYRAEQRLKTAYDSAAKESEQ